jgi:hypothetical protein
MDTIKADAKLLPQGRSPCGRDCALNEEMIAVRGVAISPEGRMRPDDHALHPDRFVMMA